MAIRGAREEIHEAVSTWEGIVSHPHRFGGTEYLLGRREIGHVHGDSLVDIPFPKKVRDEVVAAGLAEPHHVLPESGWVSFHINEPGDVERAIALLRRSFDLARRHVMRVTSSEGGSPPKKSAPASKSRRTPSS